MSLLAIAVLAGASTAIYVRVRLALRGTLDGALLSVARIEVAGSLDRPGGIVHVHDEIPVLTSSVGSGYEKFALIKNEHHVVQAQTANLAAGPPLETDAKLETRALKGKVSFGEMRRDGDVYRGIYYPSHDATGRPLVAVVAIPSRPLERSLDSLIGALLLALVLGGATAALAAQRIARRLTRPLEHIASAAGGIDGSNLQARIPDVSPDVELREVTRVLNDMLSRLEAAFSAQRRFVADASHELRSPLGNLRGTVEVALRRRREPDEYREALSVALGEVERLSLLVDELLMLSRIDTKQFVLDVAPCDLAAIAGNAVTAACPLREERDVRLRLDGDTVPIVADAHRLRQVVDNLINNALRHAPSGSDVFVRTWREDGHACLSVRDAGPGLSQAEQAQVFDRFYRADAARARDSGGLGLGLTISKAIVEAHHGSLDVVSAPGEGATFTVRVPLDGK